MSYVSFKNIYKKYENSDAMSVINFNIEIEKGEFIVFVGPSGCGKSTTLRMLAGLEDITEGEISIDGKVVNDMHPKDRDIAMVFQNYALYPHMSVGDNITFGLKIQKASNDDIKKKLEWASDVLGLNEYLNRKPKDLSGGQRQRVALGRAIVRNPKVFLMDEPLSNLDAKLRVSMRNEITKLHRDLHATTIYVTHDQTEAMTMADRIVVMKLGVVQQIGSPMNLYDFPKNTFVATFIGAPQMNLLTIENKNGRITLPNEQVIQLPEGISKKYDLPNGKLILGIRPEHASFEPLELETYKDSILKVEVQNLERMGHDNHIFSKLGKNDLILKAPGKLNFAIGDTIEFALNFDKAHFFDFETEERIAEIDE